MDAPTTKPKPLPNLTAVRLVAASLVLGLHILGDGHLFSANNPVGVIFRQGFTGVSIFFVLSGFVLAYNHPTVTHPARFYLARFARVYPLYLFALLCMVLFQINAAHRTHDIHQLQPLLILASVFMVQTWIPPIALSLNVPGWTLCIEAFFYLLFPLLLPFVMRRLKHWWRWMIGIWLIFLLPPVLIDYGPLWFGGIFSAQILNIGHGILMTPPLRVGEFLLGMFAGAHFRKHPRTFPGWTVLLSGAACLVAIYFSPHLAHEVFRNDAMALPYAGFLLLLAGWQSPFLASKPWQLGGEISYGIYLLQYPLMVTMMGFSKMLHFTNWELPVLVVLPFLAFCTYITIEKPARTMILRYFKVRGPAKPLPTPASIP